MASVLHIRLLGEFRLVYGDQPVTTVNTARLQSLLAYLVLHREAPQARRYLAFLFWPDSSEAQARTNLRKSVAKFTMGKRSSAAWETFEGCMGRASGVEIRLPAESGHAAPVEVLFRR